MNPSLASVLRVYFPRISRATGWRKAALFVAASPAIMVVWGSYIILFAPDLAEEIRQKGQLR